MTDKPPETDHGAGVKVAFSPDGLLLASVRMFGLTLWDVATGHEVKHIVELFSPEVAFGSDGKQLASVIFMTAQGGQFQVKFWNISTGKESETLKGIAHAARMLPASRAHILRSAQTAIIWRVPQRLSKLSIP